MSLAKYKWNIRFGALREWLSKSTWTEEDAQAFRDWLQGPGGTMERFKEEFFEQALPYIQGHPSAGRLVIDIPIRDERSFLLAEALPKSRLLVDGAMKDLDLERLIPLSGRIVELRFQNISTIEQCDDVIAATRALQLENVESFRLSGYPYFSHEYENAREPWLLELIEALAVVVDTILDSLEGCSTLEELVLFDTMVGDKAVFRIAEMAWPNLKSLVLSSNTITALGGEALGNTEAFSTLEKLALGYSPALSYNARDMLAESPFLPQHIRSQWVI